MKKDIVASRRQQIQRLQDQLVLKADGKHIVGDGKSITYTDMFPLKHSFADGIYIREMKMEKGSAVIGAIHNHLHVWFLLQGELIVATENSTEEFLAPCYVISKPGSKRVIYAVEDSVFVNIHKNYSNTKNIKELEADIVSNTFEEYEKYINKKK